MSRFLWIVWDAFRELFSYGSTNKGRAASQLLFIAGISIILFVVWSATSEVDRVVTAMGKAVPVDRLQTIQHYEGGRVESINVSVGESVAKGDVLLTLSPITSLGQFKVAKEKVARLAIELARLETELRGSSTLVIPPDLRNSYPELLRNATLLFVDRSKRLKAEEKAFQAREASIKAKILASKTLLNATEEEYRATQELVKRGLEAQLSLTRASKTLAEARASVISAEQELAEERSRRISWEREYYAEVSDKLIDVRGQLAEAREDISVTADRAERSQIRAPIAGTVNRVLVTTAGGTVQSAEPLVEIVPIDSKLVIDAKVRPEDIGFVRLGQKVLAKFTAYDYSVFGHINGVISIVGSDSISEEDGTKYFPVQISLSTEVLGKAGAELRIRSGMEAQVDVITGKRTVFEYVFSPITKVLDSSFREK
jgi:adhesin transport system membrane fusion protein